jgi:hypothetical protein
MVDIPHPSVMSLCLTICRYFCLLQMQTYDAGAKFTSPGVPSNAGWLFKTPTALRLTLAWLHKRYDGPEVRIWQRFSSPIPHQMWIAVATRACLMSVIV